MKVHCIHCGEKNQAEFIMNIQGKENDFTYVDCTRCKKEFVLEREKKQVDNIEVWVYSLKECHD